MDQGLKPGHLLLEPAHSLSISLYYEMASVLLMNSVHLSTLEWGFRETSLDIGSYIEFYVIKYLSANRSLKATALPTLRL